MVGGAILESLTRGSTVLSPNRGRVVSFDREGRWIYYFRDGETFKRGLASDVHLRFRRPNRQRRRLEPTAALELTSEILGLAAELEQRASVRARRRLREEVLRWTPVTLAAEADRFRRAYRPIAILPPDQYRSVVLQATEGCTWNACTFCNFYMDRPFQVASPSAFERHARQVAGLLGRGILLRRGLFLAEGNALALSNERLEPLLEAAAAIFPRRDLYGFVDLYSGDRRSTAEWRYLAERGLRRVYIGMESGLEELLAFVDKPGSAGDLERFVRTLKAARLQVSLIVMMGLGGQEYRGAHRRASRDLLRRLPLDGQDLIYLSPLVEHREGAYKKRREAAGLTAMTAGEVEREIEALAAELRESKLRVSRYDIREFVY